MTEETREIVYPFRKCIGLNEGFEIFTRHTKKSLNQLPVPSGAYKPFFVLLYGPPGCGKSYTFDHLSEIIPGVNVEDAVSISLDALAETVGKFRSKSLEAYHEGNYGKCVGAYTSTIRGTYNNSLYNKAPPKPKKSEAPREIFPSLVDLRIEALNEAIRRGLNIVYERTASSVKEDIFEDEFFSKLVGRYMIYVVYPQVVSVEELKARLARRIHLMAAEKGFARFVDPEAAELFIRTHDEYMKAYLLPRIGNSIDAFYLVFPAEGKYKKITEAGMEEGRVETPMTSCAAPTASAAPSTVNIGGRRKKSMKQLKRQLRKSYRKLKTRRIRGFF